MLRALPWVARLAVNLGPEGFTREAKMWICGIANECMPEVEGMAMPWL
jgi:hypothetical protein